MAQSFPNSRFTGYDFSEDGIAAANGRARGRSLANIRFAVQEASMLDEQVQYDLICTFDAIHDQAQPARALRNISAAPRSDGVYLMQDIRASSHLEKNLDHPAGPFLYTVSYMHGMTVSLALGGAGLGTMWGEEAALRMLAEAGFTEVAVHHLAHD
ncbi:MAG TPA: methyltransferase domain-containing protein, partial [Ktedonobacterales bacterium]|nr:methyltransferase domain-containing protein [Ktedonobacterales bacterium]